MFIKIREWRTQRAKKTVLNRIRKHAAALGHDLSMLSDDDLEKGINKAAIAMYQAGIAADEAAKAFRLLAAAFKKLP